MSSTARQTVRSLDDIDVIVDTDFHLTERQEDIFPYLESPFDEMLTRQGGDDTAISVASTRPTEWCIP